MVVTLCKRFRFLSLKMYIPDETDRFARRAVLPDFLCMNFQGILSVKACFYLIGDAENSRVARHSRAKKSLCEWNYLTRTPQDTNLAGNNRIEPVTRPGR